MTEAHDNASDELVFATSVDHIPATYRMVWRWTNAGEAELWEKSQGSIPRGLRDNEDLAVTTPDTDKPPGTGWLRLEFWIDSSALKPHSHPCWLKIRAPVDGMPILGLRIYFNERLALLRDLNTGNPH
jgi:hypothetical protein